jgi:hypothetical protein
MIRARRAAEAFTPDGLRDRVAGLGVGAHLFADEVRAGMTERETELRERLGLSVHGPLELGPTTAPEHTPEHLSRHTAEHTLEGTH